jgi:hypothetical protein
LRPAFAMKGSIYPKRSCQESSKTFHKTLGRKLPAS